MAQLSQSVVRFVNKFLQENKAASGKEIATAWRTQKKELETLVKDQVPKGRRKRNTDPDHPKAAKSAYIIFCTEKRQEIKDNNPGLATKDVTRKLGETWRNMSDRNKEKYNKLAAKDKKRHADEMAAYNAERGVEEKPKKRSGDKTTAAKKVDEKPKGRRGRGKKKDEEEEEEVVTDSE